MRVRSSLDDDRPPLVLVQNAECGVRESLLDSPLVPGSAARLVRRPELAVEVPGSEGADELPPALQGVGQPFPLLLRLAVPDPRLVVVVVVHTVLTALLRPTCVAADALASPLRLSIATPRLACPCTPTFSIAPRLLFALSEPLTACAFGAVSGSLAVVAHGYTFVRMCRAVFPGSCLPCRVAAPVPARTIVSVVGSC